ncbi:Membrane bound L-sorbosone dehydrogenase [Polystyrenella longa]|uniref:Membrane bound L-sorbosone dehydrogenase n=1 Tax=Polystyrenella longa TaxID=2528007 RepID=A0A518CHX8_9PLAN|nr:PVC-type heme-binding CxxCH protein [Polystyrenella longa]QDU78832.1 Membrane bound L-sorbosone dehydrogenase [Polystyrenella longa]
MKPTSLRVLLLTLACSLIAVESHAQDDPFATQVRPTPKLTPAEEQQKLSVPDGFEIQLFAADPQISKPLNMAFDKDGRLWITDTLEYPFPVKEGEAGRDSIKILEDTDGDGTADKITTFVDGLNIPMGLIPYKDGVIAFSIPNIWFFRDTDGDGKADQREKLYGPVGFDRDTHGLHNSFRRHFSNWLHVNHGFSNNTTVAGSDGHVVKMNSGNTYRLQLDGSRVEQFTHGQVNPFGTALDPLGNLFTADCHSKPVYQLLHGGYYPSFGKPDDGLGYVPPMMDHQHGSTAIAGLSVYIGDNFPPEYRGNTFSGNVMTSRVNRDKLEFHGSTITAVEEEDFVISEDPWFRPVDVRTGPDGALYIADFYNKIIGHYEVDLNHPERDRTSGRIWRIVYTGDHPETEPATKATPLGDAALAVLIENLDHVTLTQRMLASYEIIDRIGAEAEQPLRKVLGTSDSPYVRSHALWILKAIGKVTESDFQQAAEDSQAMVRTHAMKALAETGDWSEVHSELTKAGLNDKDSFVKRAAAEALAQHPRQGNIELLLTALTTVPEEDNHLRQMIRIAIKKSGLNSDVLNSVDFAALSKQDATELVDIMPAVDTPAAAIFMQFFLENFEPTAEQSSRLLREAANLIPPDQLGSLIPLARKQSSHDINLQRELILSILNGLQQRGTPVPDRLVSWAEEITTELLETSLNELAGWRFREHPDATSISIPWGLNERTTQQTGKSSLFIDSIVYGEGEIGLLLSKPFALPRKLEFDISGHLGPPDQPANQLNLVRLRLVDTGEIIQQELAPRNDVATHVAWELSQWAGQKGILEVVDGDAGNAYAWIAIGNLPKSILSLPTAPPRRNVENIRNFARLVREFKLEPHLMDLRHLLEGEQFDRTTELEIVNAIVLLEPTTNFGALVPLVGDLSTPDELQQALVKAFAQTEGESEAYGHELLVKAFQTVPQRLQLQLAERLATTSVGQEELLSLISDGKASARLLLRNTVQDRLESAGTPEVKEQVAELTKSLPAVQDEIANLIVARTEAQKQHAGDLGQGQALYKKHCSVCHKIGSEGALVGPQLDGIGGRGMERIIEDILDPNRNVDTMFRSTTIITDEGKIITGLIRREEGTNLILVDNKGKEFAVALDEIDEQITSRNSLMPENVSELMNESEFQDLVAYLLTQRGK